MISKPLTIFEGCDGSGKTTAAQEFAKETGARYVHFAALPRVSQNLGRFYVEAMLPALLGHQPVVFDRCWLSEVPYGSAFREGQDRLGDASRRMLERLAFRCGAVIVRCDPGWDAVKRSYAHRKHLEMLENDAQLYMVYDMYTRELTDLPEVKYNYTDKPLDVNEVINARSEYHPLNLATAGRWGANIVLVGDKFAEPKDNDAFYQWPFASFSRMGCSQWLTSQLDTIDCGEHDLLWINADQDLSFLTSYQPGHVFALGDAAHQALFKAGVNCKPVPHPQGWKRFGQKRRYPLLDLLQEL